MGKGNTDDSELNIGVDYNYVKDIKGKLDATVEHGANYICSQLVPQCYTLENVVDGTPIPCEEFWNDEVLSAKEWGYGIVAKLPNPPELESPDLLVQKRAMKALNRQIEYCHHLSISAIMFDLITPSRHLAQIIQARLNQPAQHFTFWIKAKYGCSSCESDDAWDDDSWQHYNTFRKLCGAERKMLVVLQLGADISDSEDELERWKGEMVNAVSIPLSIFMTNELGFPVLSRSHQSVMLKFLAIGAHVLLEMDIPVANDDVHNYVKYVRHLHSAQIAFKNPTQAYRNYSPGWENFLQSPLQPLMDNLECQTYVTFEADPVKYNLYHDALLLAFRTRIPSEAARATTELVVVVAGAGRGPLVNSTLEAAEKAGVKVRLYALEKNISAEVRLQFLNKTKWEGKVTIVCADMRYWNAPEKADIIVSELLGSFGDNELSPECLDGAQRFLKDDGIMIPEEYTSLIAPVMSHTLHAEVRKYYETGKPHYTPFETTYVCLMTRKYDIAKPQELFKFAHPFRADDDRGTEGRTNDRYKTLEFNVTKDCDCHGFAGYFESILFGKACSEPNITMSILPETYSKGMQSWFPLYIPIKNGISLKAGEKLIVSFWRKSTSTKVWYEWTIVSPETIPIHNVNGRSSFLGLDLAQTE